MVVVILGMHRSGTSVLARAMPTLGVNIGDDFNPITPDNPKGFWEDKSVWAVNESILRSFGIAWDSPVLISDSQWEGVNLTELSQQSIELLRTRLSELERWAFKDPRICRLLPFWQSVFREAGINPDYVLAVRNPLSVAQSLKERDGFHRDKSLLLWLLHVIPSLTGTGSCRRVIVDYDQLMLDPAAQIGRVGRSFGLSVIQGNGDGGIESYCDSFLDAGLQHHKSSQEDLMRDPMALSLAKRTWELLYAASRNELSPEDSIFKKEVESLERSLQDIASAGRYLHEVEQQTAVIQNRLEDSTKGLAMNEERLAASEHMLIENKQALAASELTLAATEQALSANRHKLAATERTLSANRHKLAATEQALSANKHKLAATERTLTTEIEKLESLLKQEVEKSFLHRRLFEQSWSWRVTSPLRTLDLLLTQITPSHRRSFDARFYRQQNRDLGPWGMFPFFHWVLWGAAEGRNPNDWFNTSWYRAHYQDVAASGMNPLVHYLKRGQEEGRYANPSAYPLVPRIEYEAAPISDDQVLSKNRFIPLDHSRPLALIIDSRWPQPDRDAGSVEAMNLVLGLIDLGYQVLFSAIVEDELSASYRSVLEDLDVICLPQTGNCTLDHFLRSEGGDLQLCVLYRVHSGGAFFETVRRHAFRARIVFHTVDLHFVREEREAALKADQRAKTLAASTRERELYLIRQTDAAIVVSSEERTLLEREVPGARVFILPLAREARTGVAGFAERSGVGFIGSFTHPPNVDAVNFFLKQVWPLVLRELPEIEFAIIGADMPETLLRGAPAGVRYLGHLPDIAPWFEGLRISVAPLRFGAGVKGKVLSSLANGVPCIVTPIGAEGIGLSDGQGILVGETPEALASLIVEVYTDKNCWERQSAAGLEFMRRELSLEKWHRRLASLLETIGLPP